MSANQASPVTSGDAEALQASYAKILESLAEAARRVVAKTAQSFNQENQQKQPSQEIDKDQLRVQMGQRVIYGQTKRGFRNEITPSRLQTLAEAIRQPVTEGASLENYESRAPRIEVKLGDEILFRQERDGVVTANQLQIERQAQVQNQQEASTAEASAQQPEDELQQVEAQFLEQEAQSNQEELLDSDSDGLTDQQELTLGTDPFSTDTDRDGISDSEEVATGTDPLDVDTDNHNGNELDNFEKFYQGVKELFNEVYTTKPTHDISSHISAGTALPEPSSKSSTLEAPDVPPAIRVASQDIEKAPEGNAKQLFNSLVTELGKEAQKLGKQAVDWVATRPEWMRNQGVASTALKLFNDNYSKTGETTYQAENYSVKLQGLNNYQINDSDGKTLMKFQKTAIGSINVTQNHMMAPDYQQFNNARQSLKQFGNELLSQDSSHRVSRLRGLAPRGDLEAINALKTKHVLTTARNFLENMGVDRWNAGEKGNYNIQRQGNNLQIDSKADGRGTVLLVKNGEMLTNKLELKDFTHFRKIDQVMQKDIQNQQVQKRPSPKKEVGLSL